jgi:hypothetical protein
MHRPLLPALLFALAPVSVALAHTSRPPAPHVATAGAAAPRAATAEAARTTAATTAAATSPAATAVPTRATTAATSTVSSAAAAADAAGAVAPATTATAPATHAAPSSARLSGDPTRVLVLGTVHLAQEGGGKVTPAAIEPVLRQLAAFDPQIITIEAMPGETCDLMARHPEVYDPEGRAQYCPDTAAAQAATGLDVPAAIAAVGRQLRDWPAAPTPA